MALMSAATFSIINRASEFQSVNLKAMDALKSAHLK